MLIFVWFKSVWSILHCEKPRAKRRSLTNLIWCDCCMSVGPVPACFTSSVLHAWVLLWYWELLGCAFWWPPFRCRNWFWILWRWKWYYTWMMSSTPCWCLVHLAASWKVPRKFLWDCGNRGCYRYGMSSLSFSSPVLWFFHTSFFCSPWWTWCKKLPMFCVPVTSPSVISRMQQATFSWRRTVRLEPCKTATAAMLIVPCTTPRVWKAGVIFRPPPWHFGWLRSWQRWSQNLRHGTSKRATSFGPFVWIQIIHLSVSPCKILKTQQ